jgi:cytochrome c-type biogenesis protein CcmH
MTGFLTWAALLVLAGALALGWPLLRPRAALPPLKLTGLLAAALMVAGGAALYPLLSNYSWHGAEARAQAAERAGVPALVQGTREHPGDVQAWLRLGAAYSSLQQWSLARPAFEQANALAQGHSAAALAGLAQVLVLAGSGEISEPAMQLFEKALQLDPASPQALFYTGIGYLQAGQSQLARDRFAAMLALGPPQGVQAVLKKQIDELDAELAGAQASAAANAASTITLQLSLAPALAGKVPAGASLFLFVPSPGGGPPLAVKRLGSQLPQQASLSGADAMLAGHGIKAGDTVKVVARYSTGGSPIASPGDLYGEVQARAGAPGTIALLIDRVTPPKP